MKPSCTCAEGRPQPDPKVGVVTVIPRTTYIFHGSTAGVPPPPTVIPLRKRIDTSEWTSGVMLVRLHAKTFPSSTSYAEVEAYNDGFTPEDPTMNFTDDLARGSTTISYSAAAGTLYPVNTVQPLASMMRVDLRFYQGTTTMGVSSLTLSVVLVGRKRRKVGEGEEAGKPTVTLHRLCAPSGERRIAVELRSADSARTEWLTVSLGRDKAPARTRTR